MERWDQDRPYDIAAKGCHMWHVCGHVYVMLIYTPTWFIIDSDLCDTLVHE
jgi:hypothetical protein